MKYLIACLILSTGCSSFSSLYESRKETLTKEIDILTLEIRKARLSNTLRDLEEE